MSRHDLKTQTTTFDGVPHVWVSCSRCHGTGQHGPASVAGGRCFGCTGADGRPTGGSWIPEATAKRRAADAKHREAKRKAAESDRVAKVLAATDDAEAKLVAVGFTDVRELAQSTNPKIAHHAQVALHAVRDHGADPAEAYADWQANR